MLFEMLGQTPPGLLEFLSGSFNSGNQNISLFVGLGVVGFSQFFLGHLQAHFSASNGAFKLGDYYGSGMNYAGLCLFDSRETASLLAQHCPNLTRFEAEHTGIEDDGLTRAQESVRESEPRRARHARHDQVEARQRLGARLKL